MALIENLQIPFSELCFLNDLIEFYQIFIEFGEFNQFLLEISILFYFLKTEKLKIPFNELCVS